MTWTVWFCEESDCCLSLQGRSWSQVNALDSRIKPAGQPNNCQKSNSTNWRLPAVLKDFGTRKWKFRKPVPPAWYICRRLCSAVKSDIFFRVPEKKKSESSPKEFYPSSLRLFCLIIVHQHFTILYHFYRQKERKKAGGEGRLLQSSNCGMLPPFSSSSTFSYPISWIAELKLSFHSTQNFPRSTVSSTWPFRIAAPCNVDILNIAAFDCIY